MAGAKIFWLSNASGGPSRRMGFLRDFTQPDAEPGSAAPPTRHADRDAITKKTGQPGDRGFDLIVSIDVGVDSPVFVFA